MNNNNQFYNNQIYTQPAKKNNNKIVIIVVLILLVILGIGGVYVYNNFLNKEEVKEPETKKEEPKKEEENSNVEEEKEEEEEPEEEYEVEDIYKELEEKLKSKDPLTIGIALWDYTASVAITSASVWQMSYEGQNIVCAKTKEDIKKRFTTDFKANGAMYDDTNVDDFIGTCEPSGKVADTNYIDTTFELKSSTSKQIVINAKSTYCESYGCETHKVAKTIEKDFVIKNVNGNWLVSSFYMPY